jgi:regulator of sigma E protease
MLTLIVFVLVLGVLIFVHEAGHFVAARLFGVKVEEFAFGFPPTLFSRKRRGTKFMINAIPLGGYVKLLGEDEVVDKKNSFSSKKARYRLGIVVAGVVMNFVLAYILLVIGYMAGMNPVALDPSRLGGTKTSQVLVASIEEGSPAETVGLQEGDFINGFDSAETFAQYTKENAGQEVTLNIERDRHQLAVPVRLRTAADMPALGVALSGQGIRVKLNLGQALGAAFLEIGAFIKLALHFLGQFFTTLFGHGKISEEVAGPIGIYSITGQAVKLGWVYVVQFIAILSLNLGLINIMPFPALDGGRAVFILIEGIIRRKIIRQEIEALLHTIGFFLLIALMAAITYRETVRFIIK